MTSSNAMVRSLSLATVLLLLTQPAWATQTFGEDLQIEDATPAFIFDDTSNGTDTSDWYIRGRVEYFSVVAPTASNRTWMRFEPSNASTAIGRGAEASDFSIAAGNFADAYIYAAAIGPFTQADGFNSIAIGRAPNAQAQDSIAVGTEAIAAGKSSVAIGHNALASGDRTIVLGSNPSAHIDGEYADVGVGISAPTAPMHIFRDDATQEILKLQSAEAGGAQDRAMMYLENNGGIRFEFKDTNKASGWRFQTQTGGNDRFEVTKVGSGEIEMQLHPNGNLYLTGNVFTNSDVNSKQDIAPVDGNVILERLASMPIAEWSYKDAAHQRHLGPMAQDFHAAFGLGEGETSLTATDLAGVSLAAVQEVNRKLELSNAQVQRRNKALEAKNFDLEQRLEQLEQLMQSLLAGDQ